MVHIRFTCEQHYCRLPSSLLQNVSFLNVLSVLLPPCHPNTSTCLCGLWDRTAMKRNERYSCRQTTRIRSTNSGPVRAPNEMLPTKEVTACTTSTSTKRAKHSMHQEVSAPNQGCGRGAPPSSLPSAVTRTSGSVPKPEQSKHFGGAA